MRQDMMLVERGAADVEESYVRPALELVDDLAGATEARLAAREADEQERDRFVKRRIAAATEQMTAAHNRSRPRTVGIERKRNLHASDTASGLRQAPRRHSPSERLGEHWLDPRAGRVRTGTGFAGCRLSKGALTSREPHSSERCGVHQRRSGTRGARGRRRR